MSLLNFIRRKETLPYDMFDLGKEAYDARKGDTIENVYHKAQERAWTGKEVLPMLIEEHGEPTLTEEQTQAIQRIFAIILWGELGAWKISAQLADALEPLEARMAATGQAFDEARHFYTMYDYLSLLGQVPERIDRSSERVLELTLNASDLAHKVCGMQLMIETIALTLFRTVRESGVEPVLCNMLRYYEIDEARHVALGVNYMPFLVREMSPLQRAELVVFQFRLMSSVILSLWNMRHDLEVLGIDPRVMLARGRTKQFEIFREMWEDVGVDITTDRPILDRIFCAIDEVLFPEDKHAPMLGRLRKARDTFVASEQERDEAYIEETRTELHEDSLLEGMRRAGLKYWTRRRAKRRKNGTSARRARKKTSSESGDESQTEQVSAS